MPNAVRIKADALGVTDPCVWLVTELLPALFVVSAPPVVTIPDHAAKLKSRGDIPLIVSVTVGFPLAEFLKKYMPERAAVVALTTACVHAPFKSSETLVIEFPSRS